MSCDYGDFQCTASGRCIDPSQRCDNRLDCDDGSDESDCDFDTEYEDYDLSDNENRYMYLEEITKLKK